MAIELSSNLGLSSTLPNFERDAYETLEAMRSVNERKMPKMFIAVCYETGKLYLFNKSNEKDEVLGKWRELVGGSGGGGTGSATLTKDILSNIDVGGVKKGTNYTVGTDLETILTNMLVKYVNPKVSFSINPSQTIYNKWDRINNLKINVQATRGTSDIVSVVLYKDDVQLNEDTSSAEFEYTIEQELFKTFNLKCVVTDSSDKVEQSTQKVQFVLPFMHGVNNQMLDKLTDSGLTQLLELKSSKTVRFTSQGDYLYFAYDASYGDLSSIMDMNGFENISDFTKKNLQFVGSDGNIYDYSVYVSKTIKVCDNFAYTFKF